MEAAAAAEAAARCAAAEARAVNAEAQVLSLRKEVEALQGAQGAADSFVPHVPAQVQHPGPQTMLPTRRSQVEKAATQFIEAGS